MRLLVVSDTHGDTRGLSALLGLLGARIDGVLHCGDGAPDLESAMRSSACAAAEFPVRGNVDPNFSLPPLRLVNVAGRRILLAHGHHFLHGSSLAPLADEARSQGASAFFFGHTHVPCLETHRKVILVNPGSLSRPRSSWGPSFAVAEIPEEGKGPIDVKFYELILARDKVRLRAFRP